MAKLRNSKNDAEEEAKKEKANAEEAVRTVEVLQKSLEMAKLTVEEAKKASNVARLAEEETKKAKTDLESRVDCLEAKVKMAEDLLAKERAELKQKIEDTEDKAIDMA